MKFICTNDDVWLNVDCIKSFQDKTENDEFPMTNIICKNGAKYIYNGTESMLMEDIKGSKWRI